MRNIIVFYLLLVASLKYNLWQFSRKQAIYIYISMCHDKVL